jgi:hypothetical protein
MGSQRKLLSLLTTPPKTVRWKGGIEKAGSWNSKRKPSEPVRRRPSGSRAYRPADEERPVRTATRPPSPPPGRRWASIRTRATQLPRSGLVQCALSGAQDKAHARRHFHNALEKDPAHMGGVLAMIAHLYEVEKAGRKSGLRGEDLRPPAGYGRYWSARHQRPAKRPAEYAADR